MTRHQTKACAEPHPSTNLVMPSPQLASTYKFLPVGVVEIF